MRFTFPLQIAKVLKPELTQGELTLEQLKQKLIKLADTTQQKSSQNNLQNPRRRAIPKKQVNLYGKPTTSDFFIPNANKTMQSKMYALLTSNYSTNVSSKSHNRRSNGRSHNHKKQAFAPIDWTQGLAGAGGYKSKARTSYQAKSEFDAMIKDWITTNWINADQLKIQKKPCHFLIHDRLLYSGLSVFDAVLKNLRLEFPKIRFNRSQLHQRWDDEFSTMTLLNNQRSRSIIAKKLRELVKTVFLPSFKAFDHDPKLLDDYLNNPDYEAVLAQSISSNIKPNNKMVHYLKNFESLNISNNFTYIKDRELSLLPNLDYIDLLWHAGRNSPIFKNFSVLQYSYVFGNKVNDYGNLSKIKAIMDAVPATSNPYFIIMTADKQTSLEYYRLLKLLRQVAGDVSNKKKGCVVFLNETVSPTGPTFFPPESNKVSNYAGQSYDVIDHFGQVYDVLEAL